MSENLVQYVIDAGNGNVSAMGMLYSRTLRTSYFLASKLSDSEAQASDITKKAYARAFCSIDKLKKPEAFEIWIKQIIATIHKDTVKFIFADADASAQEPTTDFLPEDVLADEEKAARVIDAVSKLTLERRTAVILHYNNGMPVNVLSKFLGVSESTANAVLGKARADILAYAGVEAPEFPEAATLPVLTRLFRKFTETTMVDGETVREMFTFAIEAYSEAMPKAETVEKEESEAPAEEAAPETEEVPEEEAAVEETAEEIAEESEVISKKASEEVAEEATEEVIEEAEEETAEETIEDVIDETVETEEAVEEIAEETLEEAEEESVEEITEEITEDTVKEEKDIETEIDEEKAQMEEDILSFRDRISSMLGVDMSDKSESEKVFETVEEEIPEVAEDAMSEEAEETDIFMTEESGEVSGEEETFEDPEEETFERIMRSVEALPESDSAEESVAEEPVSEAVTAGPSFGELPIEETLEEKPEDKPEKKEKKTGKKSAKVNPKIIIAAVAILAVVIVAVVLLVSGGKGEETPTTTTPVADTLKVPVEWTTLPELSDYKDIEFLNEKVSSFKESGKYGLIDYQGNVVLAAEYDGFERCSNGRYYGEGRLDESGYHILAIKGGAAYEVVIMNGTAVVSNEPHVDHATSNNSSMSGGDYDERDRYYEGYAAVRKNGKWGYIAQNSGKLVVPYEFEAVNDIPSDNPAASYDYCRGSSNGYVAVKKDGKMGVIKIEKESYKVVVDFVYEEIFQGEGGTFLAYDGKEWGNIKIGTVSDIGGADAPATETTTQLAPVTEPQEISIGKFVVNDDDSNIRTSPDTDNDDNVITALDKGYEITAFEMKEGSNGSEWVRFEYEGKEAWISSKKLDKVD